VFLQLPWKTGACQVSTLCYVGWKSCTLIPQLYGPDFSLQLEKIQEEIQEEKIQEKSPEEIHCLKCHMYQISLRPSVYLVHGEREEGGKGQHS